MRYIINREFFHYANNIFNPRNAMQISRNDGLFNNEINHSRDTIINLNTFVGLSRKYYSKDMITNILRLRNKNKI